MNSRERQLHEQLAPLGMPNDLVEVALKDEPGPSAETTARMKVKVMQRALRSQRPARPWYRWSLVAASAAALVVFAIGPSQVTARMQALLSFIPGFGMQKAESFLLYTPKPIQLEYRDGTVEIPGLMATSDQVSVRLVMRDYDQWGDLTRNVRLEDEAGRSLSGPSTSGVGEHHYWEQWLTFSGRVDPRTRTFTLVVPDGETELRIPIPVVSASDQNRLENFGPSATANGLVMSAQVQAYIDRTQVMLLLLGDFPLAEGLGRPTPEAVEGRLAITDRESTLIQENSGLGQLRTLRTETLPAGAGQVRLTVQSVIVAEEGGAQLTIPAAPGPVNQTVRLGRWDLTVTHTEGNGDKLRVYLDLGPEGPVTLHGVWDISLASESGAIWSGVSLPSENGRLSWFDLEHSQQSKTVTLQFRHPEVRFEGPWVIDVPVQP